MELKKCSKCGVTKESNEFAKSSRSKTGLASRCRTCDIVRHREARRRKGVGPRKYPIILIGDQKLCSRCKQWKHLDSFYRDKVNRGGRSSYCIECQKAYNKARPPKKHDPEYLREWRKRPEVEARRIELQNRKYADPFHRARSMIALAKNTRAKRKGLEFDLNVDFIAALLAYGQCAASGLRIDLTAGEGGKPFGPSIDRIDSTKGYTHDNVQVVCQMYNYGKNKHDETDFIAMCIAVAERNTDNEIAHARLKELRGE